MSAAPDLPGYDVLHQLGAGGTGAVWAVRRPDGLRLAAKFVDDDQHEHALQHEAALLQALHHEHVIRLHEVVPVPGGLALVMQLAEGGSLAESLHSREHLTPGELVTVLCPVARALHDLHSQGLVHGDLSPGNILFTQEGKPLIADLGFSHLAGDDGVPLWATESWAAPEVLAGDPLTPASDSYSLGAIAWTALAGAAPEPAALRPDLVDLAPALTPELRDLVISCLSHTPSARPSSEDFAMTLWQLATAAPAPVQGSTGRRSAGRAEVEDPGAQLTRRIREEARREGSQQFGQAIDVPRGRHSAPAGARAPWWRSGTVVRATAAATFLGLVAGGLILVGGGSSAGTPGGTAVTSVSIAASNGSPTTGSRQPGPTSNHELRSAAIAAGTSPSSGPAVATNPRNALRGLVQARARAWTTGRAADLQGALTPGSPAQQSDEADLSTARSAGARYSGLTFTVRDARTTSSTATTARITAMIDRSAYTVTDAAGARVVAAQPGIRSHLSLARTPSGWRISEWAPA